MSRRQEHSWGWILPLQLNSVGLEKVDVQAYTSSGLLRVGLYIAWYVKFNHSTYQYIPVHTGSNKVLSSMYVYVSVSRNAEGSQHVHGIAGCT